MLTREFLEKYPLYSKFDVTIPADHFVYMLKRTPINAECPICASPQTYNVIGDFFDQYHPPKTRGALVKLDYLCASCQKSWRFFALTFDLERNYVMKVGQYPSPDITVDKDVKRILGDNLYLFKHGRECEAQGYGVGAFAYYRRVLEEVLSALLDEITDLVPEEDKKKYLAGLEKVRKEKTAEDKIAIAKDLLPKSLTQSGVNPLATLYKVLSEGLHAKSDDDCTGLASTIREVIEALVIQINANKRTVKVISESTKKLLTKKSSS